MSWGICGLEPVSPANLSTDGVRGLKAFRSLVVKHADTRMKNVENRHNGFCICMFYHQRLWIGKNSYRVMKLGGDVY